MCSNPAHYTSLGLFDEAPSIQSFILAEMAKGTRCIEFGEGIYTLRSTIRILRPSQILLRGAGSTRTIFKVDPANPMGMQLGTIVSGSNNSGLTNRTRFPVSAVTAGSQNLTLAPVTGSVPSPGLHVLWDASTITGGVSLQTMHYRGELVTVESSDAVTGAIRLQGGVGRVYDSSPELSDVRSVVTDQFALEGIGFDGFGSDPSSSAQGLLAVSLMRRMTVRDVAFRGFSEDAFDINMCHECSISGVTVSGATSVSSGQGYGVLIRRSRFVEVANASFDTVRHGVLGHGGTMDLLVRDSIGDSTAGCDFDLHGLNEKRVTFRRISGSSCLQIGNPSWPGGEEGVLVEDAAVGRLSVSQNTHNVLVRNSTFDLSARFHTGTSPGEGIQALELNGVTLVDSTSAGLLRFEGSNPIEILVKGSMLDQQRSSSPLLFLDNAGAPVKGSFTFIGNVFSSTREAITAAASGAPWSLSLSNNLFVNRSLTLSRIAVFPDSLTGSLLLSGNTLQTAAADSSFLTGGAGLTKTIESNSVVAPSS